MLPGPKRPTERVWAERKKDECRALSALCESSSRMTAEMFLSEEPWAIALTFTPALARAEKNLPDTPTWPLIISPTAAMMAMPPTADIDAI